MLRERKIHAKVAKKKMSSHNDSKGEKVSRKGRKGEKVHAKAAKDCRGRKICLKKLSHVL